MAWSFNPADWSWESDRLEEWKNNKKDHKARLKDAKADHTEDLQKAGYDHEFKRQSTHQDHEIRKLQTANEAELAAYKRKLEWKAKPLGERISYHLDKINAPGRWAHAKIKTGAKWGLAAAAVGGGLAYLFNRSAKAASEPVIDSGPVPVFDPSSGVLTSDALSQPLPEPIGMGPKGPIYGEHTARASGIEESKTIPPRMSAGSFEDAGSAAQKYAGKDAGAQPSLAV